MSKKVIENWLNLSDYDYASARIVLDGGQYLYVAFTCQQALEKLLKAIYVFNNNETPPYIHNLMKLSKLTQLSDSLSDEQTKILENLNSYYIETRYTEELEEISKLITKDKAEEIYRQTGELLKWLKTKIK